MKYHALVVIFILSYCCKTAFAADNWNIHGFVAQGIIQAEGSNFVNDEGDTSLELTEVGLNATYRINNKLRIAGQAVYLNGGNRFANGPRIDHLFLDWQMYNTLDSHVNLYLGKIKNYHRLHSATRDVPHTRPSIILAQSLYIDVFRDVNIGSDGALFKGLTTNRFGEWEFNWNYGVASISSDQTKLFFADGASGELDLAREHQGSIYWRPSESNWQFGSSFVNATFEYEQGENDPFADGQAQTKGHYFNARYFGEYYTITAEYIRLRSIVNGLIAPNVYSDTTGEGAYLEGQFYFTPTLSGLIRVDIYDRNVEDRSGERLAAQGIPAYFGYMDQLTLGLSWNIAPKWRLQGEVHRVKGTGRLAPIIVPDIANNNQEYWNIWALQLMYWF
ncbi:TonB-dependent receptor [Aestuariibacter sp. AA17]|uniref:TonB-dependent receptor n=1 Tax=Fluctibacter corallii TaxID=2984329 RepID=A0ABT3ABW4_9ALTE|nr:TonB-dependent receptor [Aestuariibacter sp. AA17]MCV2886167.1 TonB-dependent receptor [Aestuariibacter sp. AA17]